jgi:hypothetical protein
MNILKPTPIRLALATVVASVVAASSGVEANGFGGGFHNNSFRARLSGAQETPAIATLATGEFRATVNAAGDTLSYEFTFSELEGGAATAAHVHLGQPGVAGGVLFFLCGGGSKPACPASGTITGTVVASDITGLAAQGIMPGEFADVIRLMRSGLTYANVHSTAFPSGEIRGQVRD